ncbi:MAG: ABC transporter substrate-binding protein [Ruminococcus sp.]
MSFTTLTKFEELGLEVPRRPGTSLLMYCEKIKDAGEQPLLMTYKDAWTSTCTVELAIAADLAPESFADDRKAGKTTFVGTHEEIAEKYLTLLDYAQDDYMGLSYDDGNKKFANGDAVMIINGNWAISQYRNANPDVKVNMFALPASNEESQNYVTSGVDMLLGVCKDSSNVEVAKEFRILYDGERKCTNCILMSSSAFSAVKGCRAGVMRPYQVYRKICSNGKGCQLPEDHYYPSGLDMAALVDWI